MDDTIKISREMLRAAFLEVDAKIAHRNMNVEELELKLFGPGKPREFNLYRNNSAYPWVEYCGHYPPGVGEKIRVREVLDGE